MILQIRGTSGSGKTWVMRRVMERLALSPEFIEGRKKPLYYWTSDAGTTIVVLGHYESACGGCDNIGSAAKVFELIRRVQTDFGKSCKIVCEGLLLSEDVKWTCQMEDVRVFYLSTDVEKCVNQIKSRRIEAGNEKPLNEYNTRNRVSVIERSRVRLLEAGIRCRRASPKQAVKLILKELNYSI